MADPLEMFDTYGLDAVYDVVRKVEVIVHHELYRIDVLRCYSNSRTPYTIRCRVQKDIVVRFSGEATNQVRCAWIDYGLPRTACDSASRGETSPWKTTSKQRGGVTGRGFLPGRS
jgi:hypothetical protein